MKQAYIAIMDRLYSVCMWIAGLSLIVLTTIIPFNVFMRYVMNRGLSWPEPLAIMVMIVFTFFAGAVCYRSGVHISVMLFVNAITGVKRTVLAWVTEGLMIAFNLFILYYGTLLVQATWHNFIAEFPEIRVGMTYMPLPIGGLVTVLFIIERLWTGAFFVTTSPVDNPASSD
jgi:TRAP-type C4-dicarboxylate transport system permease small subunit